MSKKQNEQSATRNVIVKGKIVDKKSFTDNEQIISEHLNKYVRDDLLVILLHLVSRKTVSGHTSLFGVRQWAERKVDDFRRSVRPVSMQHTVKDSDFMVIEINKAGEVRVTALEKWKQ